MEVAPRADPLTASAISLKRKREDDDDADLYGETETTDKKPRGEHKDVPTHNGSNIAFDAQLDEDTSTMEELVWLLFLVSQDGSLQVPALSLRF